MTETILTPDEQQQIRQAVENYSADTQAELDIRELFCKHWPTAKKVLEFAKKFLPEPYKGYVDKVINVIDWIYEKSGICPQQA